MTRAWQEHGNAMAITCQQHGNNMAIASQHGKSMAKAWQYHCNRMAMTWQGHGKDMARAWQEHGKHMCCCMFWFSGTTITRGASRRSGDSPAMNHARCQQARWRLPCIATKA
eukprot:1775818-Heterocapsa_arctica.AAC.1